MSTELPSENEHNNASAASDTTTAGSMEPSDAEKGGPQNTWAQGGGAGGFPSFPDGGVRAWLVVLGSMIIMGCSFGYLSAFGYVLSLVCPSTSLIQTVANYVDSEYQTYYSTHQLADKSDSDIAWIGSLQLCFQFASGIIAGSLFDRLGARVC